MEYNTKRPPLKVPEYGRNVQIMLEYIATEIEDKAERTKAVATLVNLIATQNPQMKNQNEYLQKIWNHMHIIADFKLDVDSPFPPPEKPDENIELNPKLPYPKGSMKYHFYGRNVELLIEQTIQLPDGPEKDEMVKIIAVFMKISYKTWNEDKVSNDTIIRHLEELSDGKLTIDKLPEIKMPETPIENSSQNMGRKGKAKPKPKPRPKMKMKKRRRY
jgi:hypothetical protein